MRAEHVKLTWETPDDDGGTPLLKYLVKVMDLDYNQWTTVSEVNTKLLDTYIYDLLYRKGSTF